MRILAPRKVVPADPIFLIACYAVHATAQGPSLLLPELPEEDRRKSTSDLFEELVRIDRMPAAEYNDEVGRRNWAILRELGPRDRGDHAWLFNVIATTDDRTAADIALSVLVEGDLPRGPRYPDLARDAVLVGVERSLKNERGSADRFLLVAYFHEIGRPGDFPLIRPFLEGADDNLAFNLVDVAARVIGTADDLPVLRFYVERWQKEAEHLPPPEETFRRNRANMALQRIQIMENRLAGEASAAESGEMKILPAELAKANSGQDVASVAAVAADEPDRSSIRWRLLLALVGVITVIAVGLAALFRYKN